MIYNYAAKCLTLKMWNISQFYVKKQNGFVYSLENLQKPVVDITYQSMTFILLHSEILSEFEEICYSHL